MRRVSKWKAEYVFFLALDEIQMVDLPKERVSTDFPIQVGEIIVHGYLFPAVTPDIQIISCGSCHYPQSMIPAAPSHNFRRD